VGWSGAGVNLRTNRPSPQQVGQAVRTVLEDPSYRARAVALATEIQSAPGLAVLDAALARVIEAAETTV